MQDYWAISEDLLCADLSGLSLQSGPSRLVKDEYSAGVVLGAGASSTTGGMDVDTETGTIQHHPPPPPQYAISPQPGIVFHLFVKKYTKALLTLVKIIF